MPLRLTIFLLFLTAPFSFAKISAWETKLLEGEKYISLTSVQRAYGFKGLAKSGNKIVLSKSGVRLEFLVGQQTVYMNRVKFVFSFPVKAAAGEYWVHSIDLVKLIAPVLRPQDISSQGGFDTVIIDPGHGGHDSGAVSSYGHGREKDHTLILAKKLSTLLRKRGFKVALTRSTDKYLTLQQRVDYANKIPNSIFISLHFNAGGKGGNTAHGIETFALSPKGVAHYGSKLKASDLNARPGNNNDSANIALATAVHSTCITKTGRADRGIRRARYSVITGVRHPAILLEGGFLSNNVEGAYIKSPAYQDRLAQGIAEAVTKYKIAVNRRSVRR